MSQAILASSRGHQWTSRNIAADTLRAYLSNNSCSPSLSKRHSRSYSVEPREQPRDKASNESQYVLEQDKRRSFNDRARQRLADRDFFANLLSSAATRRDAKAYISRLKSSPTTTTPQQEHVTKPQSQVDAGVFGRTRASDDAPIFTQFANEHEETLSEEELLHVALVKINNVSNIAEDVLSGIAQTLSSLSRLSMAPCVVLEESDLGTPQAIRQRLTQAAERIAIAIESCSDTGARTVDNLFTLDLDGRPRVLLRKILTRPLRRGRIPIILPVAYSTEQHQALSIGANEAILALTKELSGNSIKAQSSELESYKNMALDRIIIVDDTGPIPSTKFGDQRHVFVNLEQEYSALQEELRSSTHSTISQNHATNLKMFKDALRLLPASASGVLTTPLEAANVTRTTEDGISSVRTRQQKNPLIHNLLTDRPAYSSSLPTGRLGQDLATTPAMTSTVVKRGMPVTILPNPEAQTWKSTSTPRLQLTDPRIDLDKLTYLIDDSFNRKLDVQAYLDRVNDRIAGVIIAGDYEGGAILTWETSPHSNDTDTTRLVPYLDKFAVLKKSQGAGGVADLVFNAMVRSCFPNGVCWRSRKDNPVNKWYFERSRGTWKIPETTWTMFWTTPGIFDGNGIGGDGKSQTFLDYEGVCRSVKPTWADGKKIGD